MPTLRAFLATLWFLLTGISTNACERFPLLAPARSETLEDLQPTLRWSGDPGQVFRVQVAAVMPEARVVMAMDTEVAGPSLRLPAPISAERAAVKVLISRGCPGQDAQDLQAQGAWFFMDVRRRCSIDPDSLVRTASGLQWAKVEGASSYAVRVFAATAPTLEALQPLPLEEVQRPSWTASHEPTATRGTRVATVQALCGGRPGRPVALTLDHP